MRGLRSMMRLPVLATLVVAAPTGFAQTISRVSVSAAGAQSDGASFSTPGSVSRDGRHVVFFSSASNLLEGDTNGVDDVFVRDRQAGTVSRVSVSSEGVQGNNYSRASQISADGRYVVFESLASNLALDDSNGFIDVFVHDCLTGQTTRVSTASTGQEGNAESRFPTVSADGRYVAFFSDASNLTSGDMNGVADVFVHDRQSALTTIVSVSSTGLAGNNTSRFPSISADGRFVAFESFASTLIASDTNNRADAFVHDRQAGLTTRVSVSSSGAEGNEDSTRPCVSGDGQHVAFQSLASNLVVDDSNHEPDVFVHNRVSATTARVNLSSAGAQGNFGSYGAPSISYDGRFVSFDSDAQNLVPGDTNNWQDVFVRDRLTLVTTRISATPTGIQGNDRSSASAISGDGRVVVFQTLASTLVPGDTNGAGDVMARLALCEGDANGDGVVGFADLNITLGYFGQSGVALPPDFNHDGVVNFLDLNVVLSSFGTAC